MRALTGVSPTRSAAADSAAASGRDRVTVPKHRPSPARTRLLRIAGVGFRRRSDSRCRCSCRRLGAGGCDRLQLIARPFAARQRRSDVTEPGHVDGGIVAARPRASTERARSPPRSWLPGYFRETRFAVIAAPAAGLEQFGEIFQPLLGKSAPARDNVAAACHVESMCHEPARKEKNGRRRNRHESIKRDRYILWKTLTMSSKRHHWAPHIDRNPQKCGVFLAYPQSSRMPAWRRCAARKSACADTAHGFRRLDAAGKTRPETKDPSGGTTGRVKPYGRLGWMGARAEYSLDGEG